MRFNYVQARSFAVVMAAFHRSDGRGDGRVDGRGDGRDGG